MKICIITAWIIFLWQASAAAGYAGIGVLQYGGPLATGVTMSDSSEGFSGSNAGFQLGSDLNSPFDKGGSTANPISSNLNNLINSQSYISPFEFYMQKEMELTDAIGFLILQSDEGVPVFDDMKDVDMNSEVPDTAKDVNAMLDQIIPVEDAMPLEEIRVVS